jgi:hypothetical protein
MISEINFNKINLINFDFKTYTDEKILDIIEKSKIENKLIIKKPEFELPENIIFNNLKELIIKYKNDKNIFIISFSKIVELSFRVFLKNKIININEFNSFYIGDKLYKFYYNQNGGLSEKNKNYGYPKNFFDTADDLLDILIDLN